MSKGMMILTFLILLAGCSQPPQESATAPSAPAPQNAAVTHWTEKSELFMEYPPLVSGTTGRFAVHLTNLRTFKPVAEGRVTVQLQSDESRVQTFSTEAPSRPGIFGVDVQPENPGNYLMTVTLTSAGLSDSHELGTVAVYRNQQEVLQQNDQPTEERISFLKEQQWFMDFGTELAAEREMRESIRVPAEVRPRSGGEAEVIAPITGRLAGTPTIPAIGSLVSQGQPLASVIPHTPSPADLPALEFALAEANTGLEYARRDRERAQRLVAAGAVPSKRLAEAQHVETVAIARVKAATERLAQYENTRRSDGALPNDSLFTLRSPISGVIANVNAIPGSNVNQDDRLFRIVALDRVYVAGYVPEAEVHRLRQLTGAEIEMTGAERPLSAVRLVSVSGLIDPQTRTASVLYEVPNDERRLFVGNTVSMRLFLSGRLKAVAVPADAVIDDGGRPVIFVQAEGESFVRKPVKVGVRESNYVQITDGLRAGERVVTRGAYLIRLSALSTQIPAHGHVH